MCQSVSCCGKGKKVTIKYYLLVPRDFHVNRLCNLVEIFERKFILFTFMPLNFLPNT